MRRGHVPGPFSIYRRVHKLQAGELLARRANGEFEISSYWDPARIVAEAEANRLEIGEAEAIDGLIECIPTYRSLLVRYDPGALDPPASLAICWAGSANHADTGRETT